MPCKSSWLLHIPEIRSMLVEIALPVIDRAAIRNPNRGSPERRDDSISGYQSIPALAADQQVLFEHGQIWLGHRSHRTPFEVVIAGVGHEITVAYF